MRFTQLPPSTPRQKPSTALSGPSKRMIFSRVSHLLSFTRPPLKGRLKFTSLALLRLLTDADIPHAYWTGYFTSRPALKVSDYKRYLLPGISNDSPTVQGYVRTLSNYLQSARQMLLWTDQLLNQPKEFVGLPEYNALSKLEYAMATVQHHVRSLPDCFVAGVS